MSDNIKSYQIILFALICLYLFNGCDTGENPAQPGGYEVVIYSGPGIWDQSVTALLACVRNSGFSADTLGLTSLLSGNLNKNLALVLPGGVPNEISDNLGPIGRNEIREFVAGGGGLIAVGGGAVITDRDSIRWHGIGIFPGDALWPVTEIASDKEYTMTSVTRVNQLHQITLGWEANYSTLYRWGPQFVNTRAMTELFHYSLTDTPAAVFVQYGSGRVVLFGFHPEFEENSSRDDTSFGSELSDPDSEWILIENALNYILEEL